jgi:hypothetical protein
MREYRGKNGKRSPCPHTSPASTAKYPSLRGNVEVLSLSISPSVRKSVERLGAPLSGTTWPSVAALAASYAVVASLF